MSEPVDRLRGLLEGVKGNGNGSFKALCPAHEDKNPSLSVDTGDDGRALLHCHANCTTDDILQKIGLARRDLFPNAWAYQDVKGCDTMLSVRYDKPDGGKEFRPYHFKDGEAVMGDPPGTLPLYHLPEIPAADLVIITEGEKCADLVIDHTDFVATTSSHGAGSAKKSDWTPLAGKDVAILPDNDEPGSKYAEDVVGLLQALDNPPMIRVVELPGLGAGEDIEQWLERLGEETDPHDSLQELIDKAEPVRGPGLIVTCLADVKAEKVEWLWPDRVAMGKLSLLAGDPGVGKSFLSLYMAANVSQGRPWIDCQSKDNPAGQALILSAEDGTADTVLPRLESCEANVHRIHVIEGVARAETDGPDMFSMERDLRHLEKAIIQNGDIRLVVVDPLSAYLGREADTHKDADVRRVLAGLAAIAERHHVAVVGVHHLNKASSASAIYRATGSIAFVAACRAVWFVSRDTKDEERPQRILVTQAKNNLAADPGGLAFRIEEPGEVRWEPDVVWMTADEALSGNPNKATKPRDEATDWLTEYLKDGPKPTKHIMTEAEQDGLAWRTIRRAKNVLGVVARRGANGWTWELGE
jgi:hypothetical protein